MGMELIFEVRDAEEGGYCAQALGHGIFTEAETWEELRVNVLEAPRARTGNLSTFGVSLSPKQSSHNHRSPVRGFGRRSKHDGS